MITVGVHKIIGSITGNYYRPQKKFAKAMFLHVSVCPWRGGSAIGRGCLLPGGAWSREVPGQGGVPGPGGVWRPPVTATAAGGTHPTGM